MVNDYIYKRSIYSETPEGTGRAEDYRLRLSPRKASLYNTKHDNKRKLEDDFYQNHLRAIYFDIYVPGSSIFIFFQHVVQL